MLYRQQVFFFVTHKHKDPLVPIIFQRCCPCPLYNLYLLKSQKCCRFSLVSVWEVLDLDWGYGTYEEGALESPMIFFLTWNGGGCYLNHRGSSQISQGAHGFPQWVNYCHLGPFQTRKTVQGGSLEPFLHTQTSCAWELKRTNNSCLTIIQDGDPSLYTLVN